MTAQPTSVRWSVAASTASSSNAWSLVFLTKAEVRQNSANDDDETDDVDDGVHEFAFCALSGICLLRFINALLMLCEW